MKIAVFQGPVSFGNVSENIERTKKALDYAQSQGASILCMPETYLQGYFKDEEDARRNSIDLSSDEFRRILAELEAFEPVLLLGLNELRGTDLYNTQVVIHRGELLGRYSKNFLVYGYFKPGLDFPVFEHEGVKFGIIICADSSYVEPARILAMKGAEIIFSPHFNCIPYDNVHRHTRHVRTAHIARAVDNKVFVVKANVIVPESQARTAMDRVGLGVGDSFVLDPDGYPVAEAGILTERILIVDLPDDQIHQQRRPFERVSPELARILCETYQQACAQTQT